MEYLVYLVIEMGGQKKPTISKLKKMLQGKSRDTRKEEKKKVEYGVVIDKNLEKELIGYIMKQRYVTPSLVSRRGEIKISEARRFLRRLYNEGKIKLELKNGDLEVYTPVKAG